MAPEKPLPLECNALAKGQRPTTARLSYANARLDNILLQKKTRYARRITLRRFSPRAMKCYACQFGIRYSEYVELLIDLSISQMPSSRIMIHIFVQPG